MLDKKKRIRTEFKTKTLSVEVFFGKQQSFFSAYSSGCACSEIDGARHSLGNDPPLLKSSAKNLFLNLWKLTT